MSRILSYLNNNLEFANTLNDTQKAEYLLLYDRLSIFTRGTIKFNLDFTDSKFKAFEKIKNPSAIIDVDFNVNYTYETEFCKRIAGKSYDKNYYYPYQTSDLGYLLHQIMFDTDFGKSRSSAGRRERRVLRDFLLNWSKDENYWGSDGTGYLLLLGEIGIALKCLGYDLDNTEKNKLNQLSTATITNKTHNLFLVYELYLRV